MTAEIIPVDNIVVVADRKSPFDYSMLGTDEAALAREVAERIRSDLRQIATRAIERGLDLIRVQELLGRGHFGRWLKSEFGSTERTAYNWMQAARVFGANSETVSTLPERVVYKLASPSTPAPVREAIVRRLDSGEPMPVAEIEETIADARAHDRTAREEAKLTHKQRKARARAAERNKRVRAACEETQRAEERAAEARARALFEAIGPYHTALVVEVFGRADDLTVLKVLQQLVGDAP